jgi:hypothetical protein
MKSPKRTIFNRDCAAMMAAMSTMKAMYPLRAIVLVAAMFSSMIMLPRGGQTAEILTPSQVLANVDGFMRKRVTVRGVLINEGTNYFTDRRLVLRDAHETAGSALAVVAGAQIESAPGQTTTRSSPADLSDYLGQVVVMEGVIDEITRKGSRKAKGLRVMHVKIAD